MPDPATLTDDDLCDCGHCGSQDDPCECDLDMLDCTWCGGEGNAWGDELGNPMLYDPDVLYPCAACGGSGSRRDQRAF